MKLSIIVPFYNSESTLGICLDSLLAQRLEDYEIILVNDGSEDGSRQIASDYISQNGNIRCIDIDNGGQGRARNFGLDVAEGEYVGFADSDDYVSENMFGRLVDLAEKEQADIVVCDFVRFDQDGEVVEKANLHDNPLGSAGAVWNKLFRREVIGDVRFPTGLWYEDLEFSAKVLLRSGKTVYFPEALYHYRSDNVSTMRNRNSTKNLDILTIMDHIRESLPEGKMEDYRFLLINHVLLDTIKRVNAQDNEEKKEIIRQIRKYVTRQIPNLLSCQSYQSESRNRRIIMMLNYVGMEDVSDALLRLK